MEVLLLAYSKKFPREFILIFTLLFFLLIAISCDDEPSDLSGRFVVFGMANYFDYGGGALGVSVGVYNDSEPLPEASVKINSTYLNYDYNSSLYAATFYDPGIAHPGEYLRLNVQSIAGDTTITAVVPAQVFITLPLDGTSISSDQSIVVNWTAADGAENYILRAYNSQTHETLHYRFLEANTLVQAIPPMGLTFGQVSISVLALNGSGEFPELGQQTNEVNGFWAITTDVNQVTIY